MENSVTRVLTGREKMGLRGRNEKGQWAEGYRFPMRKVLNEEKRGGRRDLVKI